jgi:hypothetical protein
LILAPGCGWDAGEAWFMTASVAGVIAPPDRSAIDCQVSPARTT